MSDILKPTNYKVWDNNALVTLQFGNVPITMDYRTALDLAQKLRIVGRRAKANAGDKSMDLRALGLLSDAEADEKRAQSMRDSTAAFT